VNATEINKESDSDTFSEEPWMLFNIFPCYNSRSKIAECCYDADIQGQQSGDVEGSGVAGLGEGACSLNLCRPIDCRIPKIFRFKCLVDTQQERVEYLAQAGELAMEGGVAGRIIPPKLLQRDGKTGSL
jgi:hypothetical protein